MTKQHFGIAGLQSAYENYDIVLHCKLSKVLYSIGHILANRIVVLELHLSMQLIESEADIFYQLIKLVR